MEAKNTTEAGTDTGALIALGAVLGEVRENPHPEGRDFVILPNEKGGAKIEYLERPPFPERRIGAVVVDDTESFILATNRHADKAHTVLYASLEPASFTAVLNDHGPKKDADKDIGAHWRDHRVSFPLAYSKEFTLWNQNQKKVKSQEEFAFFIEDNLPDFKSPEGARMLEIALNFRVKNNIAFKSALKLADGSIDLQYTEAVEGGAGRTGNTRVPETFTIEIPVWSGLEAKKYVFEARLRYRVPSGSLQIHFELVRQHKVIELAFEEVLEQIKKGVKDIPIIFGKAG